METIVEKKPRKVRKDKGIKRGPRKPKLLSEVIDQLNVNEPVLCSAIESMPAFKLVDECNRGVLCEGRSYGLAMAWCKREGDTVKTVGPISPCLDYTNDQLYSEKTGKPYRAWGYSATKQSIFDGNFGYMAFAILPHKSGSKYPEQDKETEFLANNYRTVQSFVNDFENSIGAGCKWGSWQLTTIQCVESNRYVAIIPNFWCQYTYLISLWGKLMRVAIESFWVPESGKSPMDVLKKCKTTDSMNMTKILPKLNKLIEGVVPVQSFEATSGWHDEGIVSYKGFNL